MFIIVPDSVDYAINAKLDAALADCPDAEADRDELFRVLLAYFDEHGVLPEFTLQKKATP